MDETDLVTGRHLEKIPEAVKEIIEVPEKRPKVVLICITCVDALLGTDLVRVCKKGGGGDRRACGSKLHVCADA